MTIQIVLMLWLGQPKRARGKDRCYNGARPHAGGVYRSNRLYGDASLKLCRVKDCRSVAGAAFVTLPVQSRRVVDLEKERQKASIPWLFRIKINFEGLRVRANVAVSGIGSVAPTVADSRSAGIRVSTE
jgi:hypothetical protein